MEGHFCQRLMLCSVIRYFPSTSKTPRFLQSIKIRSWNHSSNIFPHLNSSETRPSFWTGIFLCDCNHLRNLHHHVSCFSGADKRNALYKHWFCYCFYNLVAGFCDWAWFCRTEGNLQVPWSYREEEKRRRTYEPFSLSIAVLHNSRFIAELFLSVRDIGTHALFLLSSRGRKRSEDESIHSPLEYLHRGKTHAAYISGQDGGTKRPNLQSSVCYKFTI